MKILNFIKINKINNSFKFKFQIKLKFFSEKFKLKK